MVNVRLTLERRDGDMERRFVGERRKKGESGDGRVPYSDPYRSDTVHKVPFFVHEIQQSIIYGDPMPGLGKRIMDGEGHVYKAHLIISARLAEENVCCHPPRPLPLSSAKVGVTPGDTDVIDPSQGLRHGRPVPRYQHRDSNWPHR